MLGLERIRLFLSLEKHRKSGVWKFFKIILYANHSSNSKGTRGDFGNSRHSVFFKLVPIIAHPLIISGKEISILFTFRKVIITIGVKARRAVFATLRVVLRTVFLCFGLTIPTLLSPAAGHITTVNQFSSEFPAVIVRGEDATQPLRITIPVVVGREHRTVREFNTDARASCHLRAFR
jgi:hypothetical protein